MRSGNWETNLGGGTRTTPPPDAMTADPSVVAVENAPRSALGEKPGNSATLGAAKKDGKRHGKSGKKKQGKSARQQQAEKRVQKQRERQKNRPVKPRRQRLEDGEWTDFLDTILEQLEAAG